MRFCFPKMKCFKLETTSVRLCLMGLLIACTLNLTACDAVSNGSSEDEQQVEWIKVEVRSFPLTVRCKGELSAANQVEIKNEVEGRTTITEIIDEGAEVRGPRMHMTSRGREVIPGTLLLTLAADEIEEKILQAQENVLRARADYVAADEALAIKKNETETTEKQAKVKVDLARLDLEKWEKGTDPQEQRTLELAVETAKRNLTIAERDVEYSKQLYEEKFIALDELERDEIALIEAKNALATAELNVKIYDEFTRPKDRQKLMTDLEQAEAELDRTIRKNRSELTRLASDLEIKTRTLALREQRLTELLEQRRNTRVYAPADGSVVYATSVGPRWRRSDPLRKGREVRFNESLILLPDTSQMIAELKVHEQMIRRVEVGQKVNVKLNALADEVFEGKVIFKSLNAEDGGWWNQNLREYVIRVSLPANIDASLQPGMQCQGEVETGYVDSVLSLPVQVVYAEGSKHYVFRQGKDGRPEQHLVEIGRASETLVEVISGLDEGDEVLRRAPKPGEAILLPKEVFESDGDGSEPEA